jgi:hypothetical protein
VRLFCLGVCVLLLACAPRREWITATPDTWPVLQAELARLRLAAPRRSWAARVSVTMREPGAGRSIHGRGAIAVTPGRAVRMILVAGPGTTMLDAWVTGERWRLDLPPLERVLRGGLDTPPDLPIGFLRWWFFRPFDGMLVAASPPASTQTGAAPDSPRAGPTWLLRDGTTSVELHEDRCARGVELVASRRSADGRVERLESCSSGPEPSPGDQVHYDDQKTGLAVEITLEAVVEGGPPPEAFDDPDAAHGT